MEKQSQAIVVGIVERFWAGIVERNCVLIAGKRLLIESKRLRKIQAEPAVSRLFILGAFLDEIFSRLRIFK